MVVNKAEDMNVVRELFLEYATWLGEDMCFQGFEEELATLPGKYAEPKGRLYLLETNNKIAGCGAIRPLSERDCEMKRLYVRDEFKRKGYGKRMAQTLIEDARKIGYQRMLLDTLSRMTPAITLYRSLGFKEVEAYYNNPICGVVYLGLDLQ